MKRNSLQIALLIQNIYDEQVTHISEDGEAVYIDTLSGKSYTVSKDS